MIAALFPAVGTWPWRSDLQAHLGKLPQRTAALKGSRRSAGSRLLYTARAYWGSICAHHLEASTIVEST